LIEYIDTIQIQKLLKTERMNMQTNLQHPFLCLQICL